jgi:Armadillo/beta-catenin-like repeat
VFVVSSTHHFTTPYQYEYVFLLDSDLEFLLIFLTFPSLHFAVGYASYLMGDMAADAFSATVATLPDGAGPRPLPQYRDPELSEVIDFLKNPSNVIKANAAAHLAHLAFMNDQIKNATRQLNGIPPLLDMLSSNIPEIQRNACSALRNLSFGRGNDENKVQKTALLLGLVRHFASLPFCHFAQHLLSFYPKVIFSSPTERNFHSKSTDSKIFRKIIEAV